MALEIRSPRAATLARELASATGEDIATAVERAIEERLTRVPRRLPTERQAEVEALFDRLARMPVLDARASDEIIGFDRHGLPRPSP
jgi:antitoxin VapB